MNTLKSLRQTADSKSCSVDDSRSFLPITAVTEQLVPRPGCGQEAMD